MSLLAGGNTAARSAREKRFHDEVDIRVENRKVHVRLSHVFASPNTQRAWRTLDAITARCVRGARVLDFGCGKGASSRRLAALGAAAVDGIDISSRCIEAARTGAPGPYRFFEHDAHLPLPERYDVIFGKAILHHLDYREVLPRLARDNLTPGGRMIFVEPLGENVLMRIYWRLGQRFHTPDERPFRRADLRWLEQTFPGFELIPFNYASLLAGIVSSFVFRRPDNGLMRACDRLDQRLARLDWFRPRFRSAIFQIPAPTTPPPA